MTIQDLSTWTAPDGLGKSLTSAETKYDLVHGPEYTDAVTEHLKRSGRSDLTGIYSLALSNKDSSGIIRAKRAADGAILGSLLCCRSDSTLASFMPGFANNVNKGLISSPVISSGSPDRHLMLQGLVLLGVRQLKRQGVRTVVFDYASVVPISFVLQG